MPPKEDKAVNIPWNEGMVESLLNLVVAKGPHLHKGTVKATELWIDVHNTLFDQPEYNHLKKMVTKLDKAGRVDVRKVKEKFVSIKEAVQKKKESGNLSGLEGDLSPIFSLVKQITDEEAEAAEQALQIKANDLEGKKKLETNEALVLSNPLKKRKTKQLAAETFESTAMPSSSSSCQPSAGKVTVSIDESHFLFL